MQTVEIGSFIRRRWWVLPYMVAAYLQIIEDGGVCSERRRIAEGMRAAARG